VLGVLEEQPAAAEIGPASWEATNLLTVAAVLTQAAALREETRGGHWREDFPDARPVWLGHITSQLAPDGTLQSAFTPALTHAGSAGGAQ